MNSNLTGNGQGEGGSSGEDGEDQDDPSSSFQAQKTELNSFREEWRKDLESTSSHAPSMTHVSCKRSLGVLADSDEEKARQLFLQGVENEQKGKLYEAIQFYKRAVQLVPDIEFRLYESTKSQRTPPEHDSGDEGEILEDELEIDDEEEEEEFDPSENNLMAHLQRVLSRNYCICQHKLPQNATHISALPVEIILYILRWVVSSDLDMRSLEACSAVCRGFYVCCRDPEIWRLACVRVWGMHCGALTEYNTWREMYLKRPRLHFNGCYISKTTYVRSGENSFQDQFYRPWHLVQYYRYLRFFPEGRVLMLTTAEEPPACLGHLKGRHSRHPAVMVGHFRLSDDRVTLTVQKQDALVPHKSRRKNNNMQEQTFHLEFEIVPRSKNYSQLRWQCYSVFTKSRNGHETSSAFEVVGSRFPSLWFSRVKSYTAEADFPLM